MVTGGAGFLGAAIARHLHTAGYDVHAVVRPSTGDRRVGALPEGVAVHRADLADLAAITEVVRRAAPRIVVHAAASHGHPATGVERIAAWRDTVVATAALLEALRAFPPDRLVHLCSSLVYRPASQPLGEHASLGPETARGAVKLAAAIAVEQWSAETGIPAVILRPFSVYGAGQDPNRVIPTLLRSIADGTTFPVTGRQSTRDFVHVDDVARCVAVASGSKAADGRVLNVATGVETSITGLVALAELVTGKTVLIDDEPFPPVPPRRPHWVADPSLAAELLGWRADVALEDGLRELWWSR
jgi:UDP-glucose 4-epimerase